jgi:long-subunit acyl-CoA synthetase (AMP-forming)
MIAEDAAMPHVYEDDFIYSFLPMAHAAEKIASYYVRIQHGIFTCFGKSI